MQARRGYAEETEGSTAVTAGGAGMGVRSGPATAVVDSQVQATLLTQDAIVAGQTVTQAALSAINATQGTTGAGDDLASQLGALQDAFTALSASPSSTGQQLQVISAASTLAGGINQMADAYQTGIQSAQDSAGRRGHHAEPDPGADRHGVQPDRHPAAAGPEHGRSPKPAQFADSDGGTDRGD